MNNTLTKEPIPARTWRGGYTLIELIVAVGLFAVIMTLASGAYLMMISVNRQAQGIATGINNLSFALETMTRTIRTGTAYNCLGGVNVCTTNTFTVTNSNSGTPKQYTYAISNGAITQNGVPLTDSSSVTVSYLMFYATGMFSASHPAPDYTQPYVTIVVSGTVSSPGKPSQTFTVQTGATMRGSDL